MLLPAALAFLPGAQLLQFSAPPRAYWPLAQFSQTVAVVLVLCWPALHSVHSQAMLSVLLNVPVGQADLFSGHGEQTLLPMAAKKPKGHAAQSLADAAPSAALDRPALQKSHVVLPSPCWWRPVAHCWHWPAVLAVSAK